MFTPLQHATWEPKGALWSRACGLKNISNKQDQNQRRVQEGSLWVQVSHLSWGRNCDSKHVSKTGSLSSQLLIFYVRRFSLRGSHSHYRMLVVPGLLPTRCWKYLPPCLAITHLQILSDILWGWKANCAQMGNITLRPYSNILYWKVTRHG